MEDNHFISPLRPINPPADIKPGFTCADVNQTTWIVRSQYRDLAIIGHGAYGVVCSAVDEESQRKVAIKRLTKPFDNSEYGRRTYREIKILNHMDHENIVPLLDAFSPQTSVDTLKDIYLVTPLMETDLELVIKHQDLSDSHINFIVYQILRGLKYMHSADLIHRDLKPVNIVINRDCECRIVDFGLARQTLREMTGYVITRWYRAPEVILNWTHYNESVDIWSVACIMVEMRIRKPLFNGANYLEHVETVFRILGKPDAEFIAKITSAKAVQFLDTLTIDNPKGLDEVVKGFPSEGIDLLYHMLHLDPGRRYTAAMALAHPYFENYHDESDEPVAHPYFDPFETIQDITVEEWRNHVWNLLEFFVPNISSLTNT